MTESDRPAQDIFIAGATGVIGHRVVRRLTEGGHRVTGIARDGRKAELLNDLGAHAVRVDLFDRTGLEQAIGGHEVVINLATQIPPFSEAGRAGAWEMNDRIRSEGSRNLVEAARACGVERYIQESVAFAYPDRGDAWIDEEVELRPGPPAKSALTAEANARSFAGGGRDAVILRFGQFYGPDSGYTRAMVRMARWWLAPVMGPPGSYLALIHLDDAARAVEAALETPPGVYNITEPRPVTRRSFARTMAEALGRRRLYFLPDWLVRRMGEGVQMLARSQRVSSRRFQRASGWRPEFESAEEGLPPTVSMIRDQ